MRHEFGNPQGGKVCITLQHRSQINKRTHFPPSVPEDRPSGSEGRDAVVKPQQEKACWAATCLMMQPCLFLEHLFLSCRQRHTGIVAKCFKSTTLELSVPEHVTNMSIIISYPLNSCLHCKHIYSHFNQG